MERVSVSIAEHGMNKKGSDLLSIIILYYMQRLTNYPQHCLKPNNDAIVTFGAIKELSMGADFPWVLLAEENGERGTSVRFRS